jgi:DNA-binding NarL/FixJ family response regulator
MCGSLKPPAKWIEQRVRQGRIDALVPGCPLGWVAPFRENGNVLPIRVAAVNDYELIVEGVAGLLRRYPDRLLVCDRIVIGDPIEGGPIAVALYDTYGRVGIAEPALRALIEQPGVERVAIFSLDLRPELVKHAIAAGASGFISKSLSGDEVADALVRVAAGEHVAAFDESPRPAHEHLQWPGKTDGLSERESQVLVLCAEGLTNREIAVALYIGVETVKTHLRNVFAKLDLRNRVEAAAFVQRSGAFTRYQPADPTHPDAPVDAPTSESPDPISSR